MSEDSELDNLVNDLVDQYLLYLRGRGPEPDLAHLSPAQRRAMQARLEVVDALADRDLVLPALEDDPVARRLGLVPDRHGTDGQPGENSPGLVQAHEQAVAPVRRILDELQSAFDGQVVIDWDPPWGGDWHNGDLQPLAQCSVLGDSMALFVTEHVSEVDESARLASFLRTYPDVSAVGLVSADASRAAIVTAAACNRAIDPVRGWLEPGTFLVTDSLDLTLTYYFERRLPRWERVAGLTELLEMGDFSADANEIVTAEFDTALNAKPRLEHKRQAQQGLRELDQHVVAALVVAVQKRKIAGGELVARALGLVEAAQ